jgi:two-component system nitrate/nitrite response regulator NarL
MKRKIRVMMIEDHPDYREGVSLALETETDIELLNTFGTAERALRSLQDMRERKEPDVVLLDLNLPGISGLEALPFFRSAIPDAKILVLTQSDLEADVLEAIRHGAAGYLLKSASLDKITDSIRTVMAGGASLDPNVASYILGLMQKKPAKSPINVTLSERETEVLVLLGDGLLKKEISDQLKISQPTVATHVRHIYEKLEVQNAPAAINKAYRAGILPLDDSE